LPSSLTRVLSPTLGCLPQPTSVGLRYGQSRSSPDGFSSQHGLSPVVLTEVATSRAPSARRPTEHGRTMSNGHAGPIPLGPRPLQRNETGAGILTGCPSPTPAGLGLGPPNPTRMTLASEPSGFRWADFASAFTLLMPAFALPSPPPAVPRQLLGRWGRSPTMSVCRSRLPSTASVGGLSPGPLSAQHHSTSELLRTL
jgi:hypothetical protein